MTHGNVIGGCQQSVSQHYLVSVSGRQVRPAHQMTIIISKRGRATVPLTRSAPALARHAHPDQNNIVSFDELSEGLEDLFGKQITVAAIFDMIGNHIESVHCHGL